MKKVLTILLSIISILGYSQTVNNTANTKFSNQVNIGKTGIVHIATHNSAWLEIGVDNTTKALRISRGDTSTVLTPTYGLIHYQMSDGKLYWRDNTKWNECGVPANTYVKYNDSLTVYVTPSQLNDSLENYINSTGYGITRTGQYIEIDTTAPNGLATIYDLSQIRFSLCDTLATLPTVPFTTGMKFLTSGGGGIVPSTWVGYDFDIPNDFPTTTDATDLYLHLIETPATTYYYPPATTNPTTPISFLNTTAINAFIDQHIGDFGGVPGDIIVVVNNDNTVTVWQNPSLTIGGLNMFWAGPSSPDNYTGKAYPTIPTTHTATIGGGCGVVELTACDLLSTIPIQPYLDGSKAIFVGSGSQTLNGDYIGWSLPENGGWYNTTIFDNRVWAVSIINAETNGLPAFAPGLIATSSYPSFQALLDVINASLNANGNLFKLIAVGNDRVLLADMSGNFLSPSSPYLTANNYSTLSVEIMDNNVTNNDWLIKNTHESTFTLTNVIYSGGGGCYVAELPQQANISMINDGFNNMSITDYGGTLSAPIISNNSLSLVGQNLTSNVNGVSSSITLPVAQLDSSTWNKVGTTLPSDDVTDNIYHTGAVGIGTTAPNNNLHISNPFVPNTGGIRLPITSASADQLGSAIGVNASGDIVKIAGGGGGATTNTLTNPTNTITSTVNGVVATAPSVNTVVNTFTSPNLTTTVNGVSGTAVDLSTLITANNGLTKTALNLIQRGGNLVQNTTETLNGFTSSINGSAINTIYNANGRWASGPGTLPDATNTAYIRGGLRISNGSAEALTIDSTAYIHFRNNTTNGMFLRGGLTGMQFQNSTFQTVTSLAAIPTTSNPHRINGATLVGAGLGTSLAANAQLACYQQAQISSQNGFRVVNGVTAASRWYLSQWINSTGGIHFGTGSMNALTGDVGDAIRMTLLQNGDLGIGTTAPSQRLHVIGNILATGTITPSDNRLKKNIFNYTNGLGKVLQLQPKTYNFKGTAQLGVDSTETKVGYIAQDYENVFGSNSTIKYDHYYSIPQEVTSIEYATLPTEEYLKHTETDTLSSTHYYIDGIKQVKAPDNKYLDMAVVNAIKELYAGYSEIRHVTATTTLLVTDGTIITDNTASITLNFPTPSSCNGKKIVVARGIGAGAVTLAGAQIQRIGSATYGATTTLGSVGVTSGRVVFQSDGTNWNYID